jgi:hypothetical protein
VIALYDRAFQTDQNIARVLAHEFSHKLYRRLSIDDARSYNSAGDWLLLRTPRGDLIFAPDRDGYVEDDGREGPDEDFCNNLEYFLFNPHQLKTKTPKVYDWIRKKFGDKFKLAGATK